MLYSWCLWKSAIWLILSTKSSQLNCMKNREVEATRCRNKLISPWNEPRLLERFSFLLHLGLERVGAFKQIKSLLAAAPRRVSITTLVCTCNLIKNTRSAALHSIKSRKVCALSVSLAANKSIASALRQARSLDLFLHASMGLLPPVGVK